jgi:membrane-associated protease RseP (regulator of RpoE activity)
VIPNRKVFQATAWALTLGLVAATGAVRADIGDGGDGKEQQQKRVVKREIVIVDKDGKQRVIEGAGPMMRRGYLGVGLMDLTPELRQHFGVPEDSGVMVSKVEPGSPADKAGIRVGDILTRIDGNALKSSWSLMDKVRQLDDGQQIPVEIWRNGKAQNLTATVVEKERPELDMGPMFFKEKDGDHPMLRMNPDEWKRMAEKIKAESMAGPEGPHIRLMTSPREAELEKRLKELEQRIADLEKQLKRQ